MATTSGVRKKKYKKAIKGIVAERDVLRDLVAVLSEAGLNDDGTVDVRVSVTGSQEVTYSFSLQGNSEFIDILKLNIGRV